MLLGEIAYLLDVEPKWVLNTCSALRRPRRYSLQLAQQLAVARVIIQSLGASLPVAWQLAQRTLDAFARGESPVTVTPSAAEITLVVDVQRILSTLNVRRAALASSIAPRQRGRRAGARRDKVRAAAEWGIDVSLLAANLRLTPEQRLRQLDAMAAFAAGVRRVAG